MSQNVAVVTGATGGIGRWIALGLAKAGCLVVMVGRETERLKAAEASIVEKVENACTETMLADLSSLAHTRALALALTQRHPAISVLVNNAGIFLHRREVTPEGREKVLAVNHLSPFILTNALKPALEAAGAARIVTVGSDSSDNASINPTNLEITRGWNMVSAYRRSKLAQMMTTFQLAEQLTDTNITANVVHPGAVATGLVRAGGPIGLAWKMMAPFLLSEQQGADTPIYTALSPEMNGISGKYLKRRKAVMPNSLALDPVFRRRVWEETERLVSNSKG